MHAHEHVALVVERLQHKLKLADRRHVFVVAVGLGASFPEGSRRIDYQGMHKKVTDLGVVFPLDQLVAGRSVLGDGRLKFLAGLVVGDTLQQFDRGVIVIHCCFECRLFLGPETHGCGLGLLFFLEPLALSLGACFFLALQALGFEPFELSQFFFDRGDSGILISQILSVPGSHRCLDLTLDVRLPGRTRRARQEDHERQDTDDQNLSQNDNNPNLALVHTASFPVDTE